MNNRLRKGWMYSRVTSFVRGAGNESHKTDHINIKLNLCELVFQSTTDNLYHYIHSVDGHWHHTYVLNTHVFPLSSTDLTTKPSNEYLTHVTCNYTSAGTLSVVFWNICENVLTYEVWSTLIFYIILLHLEQNWWLLCMCMKMPLRQCMLGKAIRLWCTRFSQLYVVGIISVYMWINVLLTLFTHLFLPSHCSFQVIWTFYTKLPDKAPLI